MTRVSAERSAELILTVPDLVVIDSRRGVEHAKGHLEGAVSLPDTDMTEQSLADAAGDKRQPLLFYCNGERCGRSANACEKAVSWGYQRIYWLRGGWNEWVEMGLPVSR